MVIKDIIVVIYVFNYLYRLLILLILRSLFLRFRWSRSSGGMRTMQTRYTLRSTWSIVINYSCIWSLMSLITRKLSVSTTLFFNKVILLLWGSLTFWSLRFGLLINYFRCINSIIIFYNDMFTSEYSGFYIVICGVYLIPVINQSNEFEFTALKLLVFFRIEIY